jgi:serine/threonine-protein kinase RsbW
VLDEVRLAVGEACSRAVHLHRRYCPDRPVMVTLVDDPKVFRVVVADEAPNDDANDALDLEDLTETADLDDVVPPGVGLAVIAGLVDDVSVEQGGATGGQGITVRMSWPTPA